MSKIGMVVCGNSGIDYIKHDYNIKVLRSILFIGDKEYTDFIDITAEDFYSKLKNNPALTPTTAQAATGVILETFEELRDNGCDQILCVTVSNKLSGTHQGAMMAANMVEGVRVTVYDSLSVAYPEAKMILTAAKMAEDGRKIDEIIDALDFIKNNHTLYVSVNTLKYLVKNGRLSGASGFVGSLLKIKPLLVLTKDGRIESKEKIRTTSKATEALISKFLEDAQGLDIEPYIVHSNATDRIDFVKESILAARPDLKEVKDYPLTPVVGAHAGPGALALGFILNKK